MDQVTLEINGNSYKLKFGISCLRILGSMWNIPTLNGVLARVSVLDKLEGGDISFEAMDILEDVVKAAIRTEKTNVIVESDFDGLIDFIIMNQDKISEVFKGLVTSMPVADSGKSKAPKGANKKN